VPGGEDSGDRWSLDHLFLDQDAVPTLVEVKRSSDTRLRREVVGQMLDYAANAVLYWPVETIRARFERTCEDQGLGPATALSAFPRSGSHSDSFWQTVKTNLQAGRVRLVFVADEIPPELRRVVEFLNGQMDPAEVFAVEVKQYAGQGSLKTLVPRLVGQTAAARKRKGTEAPRWEKTDEAAFLEEMLQCRGAPECGVARQIIEWARRERLALTFNKWKKSASFIPIVHVSEGSRYPISLNTGGSLWVQMRWLRQSMPFAEEANRQALCQKLNAIPGVKVPPERMIGFPAIPLQALTSEAALRALLDTLTWLVEELRAAPA